MTARYFVRGLAFLLLSIWLAPGVSLSAGRPRGRGQEPINPLLKS